MEHPSQTWTADALNRKAISEFLTKVLINRFETYHREPGSGALCLALDADWGWGKSYFVAQWSGDVAALGHPIVRFDAWVNDLADDPLLGFMARLQSEMKPWLSRLPVSHQIRTKAVRKFQSVMKNAGRVAIPLALKMGTGLSLDALTAESAEDVGDAVKKAGGEALTRYFDQALKSHTQRHDAIEALKVSLEELFIYLDETTEVPLPMFVFVDELDRCRPDYAIKLLEGVKHLFDAQGICFIFSTNMKQLAASAKSVYGESFDSERYLQRFFSFQYHLPTPDNAAYAKALIQQSAFNKASFPEVVSVQQKQGDGTPSQKAAHDFALVAGAFNLDLRSQKQVLRQAEAVISVLDRSEPIYPFYLFVLTAVLFRSIEKFETLTGSDSAVGELSKVSSTVLFIEVPRRDGSRAKQSFPITQLFKLFHDWSRRSVDELIAADLNRHSYPECLLIPLQRRVQMSGAEPSASVPLGKYLKLVRTAGQISA